MRRRFFFTVLAVAASQVALAQDEGPIMSDKQAT
jgi:hypothetical protein